MIIHSVLPPKLLLAGLDELENKTVKIIDGVKVEAVFLGENSLKVTRVLSTNPKDFLHPKLQPGSIISANFK